MESRKEFYYRLILLLLIMIIIILVYRLLDSLGLLSLYFIGIPSARTRGEGRRMDLHRERDFVLIILIALFLIAILLLPMIFSGQ